MAPGHESFKMMLMAYLKQVTFAQCSYRSQGACMHACTSKGPAEETHQITCMHLAGLSACAGLGGTAWSQHMAFAQEAPLHTAWTRAPKELCISKLAPFKASAGMIPACSVHRPQVEVTAFVHLGTQVWVAQPDGSLGPCTQEASPHTTWRHAPTDACCRSPASPKALARAATARSVC